MAEEARAVVLVVDDDQDHGYMLEALLDSEFQVLVATSRRTARAVLESRSVDVLLTDYSLGDGCALDLLKDLAPASRPRVAIVLSGFDEPSDVERTLDAGFDAHLGKPASLATLRQTITAGLRGELAHGTGVRLER